MPIIEVEHYDWWKRPDKEYVPEDPVIVSETEQAYIKTKDLVRAFMNAGQRYMDYMEQFYDEVPVK